MVENREAWYKSIYRDRYHLSVLVQRSQLLGIAIAYPQGKTLIVEWVVTLQPGAMQEFLDRIPEKYPLTEILQFNRQNRPYTISLAKIKKIQRIFNHG